MFIENYRVKRQTSREAISKVPSVKSFPLV